MAEEKRESESRRIEREMKYVEKEIAHEVELAEKLLKRFSHTEAAHTFIGAVIAATVAALLGQILIFGIVTPWPIVIAFNIAAVAIVKGVFYVIGYKHAGQHHVRILYGTTKRVLLVYGISLLSAGILLTLVRPAEWAAWTLALKQIFALALPAVFGGLLSDILLNRPHGMKK